MRKQYESVFSIPKADQVIHDYHQFFLTDDDPTGLKDFIFTKEDIQEACKELSSSSAAGDDGVPAVLLIKCRTQLSIPLHHIWRRSLDMGIIPSSLLHAMITPLHKGGSRT